MKPGYCLVVIVALALPTGPAAAERRDRDAHVHGAAALDVAVLGDEVEIDLRSPAVNIVGFEHEPRTENQRARLTAALAALREGTELFALPGADCALREARVRRAEGQSADDVDLGHDDRGQGEDHADAADGHGHEQDEDQSAAHSEIRAHYRFRCAGRVRAVRVALFERFPGTGSVRVQYLTGDLQGARTLTPDAATLRFE
ncbi:MAG: DUF2796 domain-containing protein [Halofilum sp. (in: g-proteobacteria)]|nr:DUF2796 domain-containing protein [Halofilum sp. (in: g-proteobacteria)]